MKTNTLWFVDKETNTIVPEQHEVSDRVAEYIESLERKLQQACDALALQSAPIFGGIKTFEKKE